MYLKKFVAPVMGLTVADVVSAAKIRFAPWRGNRSQHPQLKEVFMSSIKKLVAPVVGLIPAGSWSAAKIQAMLLALILGVFALLMGPAAVTYAAKEMVKDPTTGKMVTAPEYGGTFTLAVQFSGLEAGNADTYHTHTAAWFWSGILERVAMANWGIDRSEVSLHRAPYFPLQVFAGQLAESWEIPDGKTLIFHIRKGVKWQNKAPVNGRELDATDLEFNYHRMMGMGSGFTEPSPHVKGFVEATTLESVKATDKWTLVLKLREDRVLSSLGQLLDHRNGAVKVYAPEVIKQYGDAKDWKTLVGTGPWMIEDYVEGSSMTWVKHPDYWGHDEKWPENRLPYADGMKQLSMGEEATRIAALRTAKVDGLFSFQGAQISDVATVENLQKTDPHLIVYPFYFRSNYVWGLNVKFPPFDDRRVHIALQKALNLEEINKGYFLGWGRLEPQGQMNVELEAALPFDQWPQEIQDRYAYDPEVAEKLLDEAGYPRGADGVRFETELLIMNYRDVTYPEICADYWRKIGVEVKINVVDATIHASERKARTWKGIIAGEGAIAVEAIVSRYWSQNWSNLSAVEDPEYDAMYEAYQKSGSREKQLAMAKKMHMYEIEHHWTIWGPEGPGFSAAWPWITGYNGEHQLGANIINEIAARLWINQDLKSAMGY